jgi:hypothetical protein
MIEGTGDMEEDVNSYWVTLSVREDAGPWKRKH